MSELKPCPFCGGEARMSYEDDYYFDTERRVFVKCCRCGNQTQKVAFFPNKDELADAEMLAVNRWNRRVKGETH